MSRYRANDHIRAAGFVAADPLDTRQTQDFVALRRIERAAGGSEHGDGRILDAVNQPVGPLMGDVGQEDHDLAQQHRKRGKQPQPSREALPRSDMRRCGTRIRHKGKVGGMIA